MHLSTPSQLLSTPSPGSSKPAGFTVGSPSSQSPSATLKPSPSASANRLGSAFAPP